MNPYALLAQSIQGHQPFFDELSQWHDEMVLHQRSVRRLGQRGLCSEECPHAEGRRLWQEAKALLGSAADGLTFLRQCASEPARTRVASAHARPRP